MKNFKPVHFLLTFLLTTGVFSLYVFLYTYLFKGYSQWIINIVYGVLLYAILTSSLLRIAQYSKSYSSQRRSLLILSELQKDFTRCFPYVLLLLLIGHYYSINPSLMLPKSDTSFQIPIIFNSYMNAVWFGLLITMLHVIMDVVVKKPQLTIFHELLETSSKTSDKH